MTNQNPTGNSVESFKDRVEEEGRIFIPDDFDEIILSSVVKYVKNTVGEEVLQKTFDSALKMYLNEEGAVKTIKEFGNKVDGYIVRMKATIAANKEFKKLLKETRARMGGSTEL